MPKVADVCPYCKKNLSKLKASIGCAICGFFSHAECVGISDTQVDWLYKNRAVKFTCKSCCEKANTINNSLPLPKNNSDSNNSNTNNMSADHEDFSSILLSLQKSINRLDDRFNNISTKIDAMAQKLREELCLDMQNIKDDVKNCNSRINEVDKSNQDKINKVASRYNTLERRQNRSDILIYGLPQSIKNIEEIVKKIGELFGITINETDINHCCHIHKKKCILVKFNSTKLRDKLMQSYFKSKPICQNDITDSEATNRIYLNDNLSPSSNKLNFICRKLRLKKMIKKFNIINMDSPKAKITKLNDSIVVLDLQQCSNWLDKSKEPIIN